MYEAVTARVRQLGPDTESRFTCHLRDFLRAELPTFDVLVANIPYQISSPIVRRILTHEPPPSHAVIMFQAEFALRLAARPGTKTYSRLSVNTQLLADVQCLFTVKRGHFRPPPKVDSIVVRITPKAPPEDVDLGAWENMLRLCFQAKNKTLRAIFRLASVRAALRAGPISRGAVRGKQAVEAEAARERVGEAYGATLASGHEVGGQAPSSSPAASRHTVADGGPAHLADAPERAMDVIIGGGWGSRRPNSMSVSEYLQLYRALVAAGVRL